jgi:hypothetical protein
MDFGFANAAMFSNPTFGVDTTGLSGPKNPLGSKSGGKSMFDPLSAAFTAAGMGLQGILGATSSRNQANTMAKIAGLENAIQNESILNSRDMAKAQMGMGMFNTVYSSTTGSDLDYGRQLAAQRAKYNEFIPKQLGLQREQARWENAFALSPAARELARREREGRVKEAIAPGRAQMTGMFGRIAQAPTESFMV